jgi:hypothetical protein
VEEKPAQQPAADKIQVENPPKGNFKNL